MLLGWADDPRCMFCPGFGNVAIPMGIRVAGDVPEVCGGWVKVIVVFTFLFLGVRC